MQSAHCEHISMVTFADMLTPHIVWFLLACLHGLSFHICFFVLLSWMC